jgi:hypothetical protein
MSSQAAKPAIHGNDYEGFTATEKKFLEDLSSFLGGYHGYAGSTRYDEALASTFDICVTVREPRASQVPCKKWCPDPRGRLYCCEM